MSLYRIARTGICLRHVGAGVLASWRGSRLEKMTTRRRRERRGIAAKRKRSLLVAVEGKEESLAFVDAVGVRDFGIGLHYAAPGCGSAGFGFCDFFLGICFF